MSTNAEDDGFLARWSRRKSARRSGDLLAEAPARAAAQPAPSQAAPAVGAAADDRAETADESAEAAVPVDPPPRLEDVQSLTPASDFARFARTDVDPAVRNAAMKKLFADPRFNVIDEMDIDIMDYNKLEPLHPSLLRRMTQAQALGLFDDEEADEASASQPVVGDESRGAPLDPDAPPAATTDTRAPTAGTPTGAEPSPEIHDSHEDPDLRLQPDDAAGPAGDRPRAGEDAERQR